MKQANKKPCLITTVHGSFDSRIFHKQAKTLVQAGYDVSLIAKHDREQVIDGVKLVPLPKPRDRFTRIFGLNWRAFRLALKQKGDIYHFHDPEFLLWGWLLQKLTRKPVIYDVHEYYSDSISTKPWLPHGVRGAATFFFDFLEKAVARRLAGVVAVNQHMGRQFSDRGCRVCVLPNYPPRGLFEVLPSIPDLQRIYEEHEVLIYIGGLSESRGITQAIRVMHHLCEQLPTAKLLLAGRFESDLYQQQINKLINELNLADRVDILGVLPHPEVVRYLALADIGIFLVQPVKERYNWGEPIKFFEYSAAGLPIVISDLPAKRRLIERVGNGVLVDPTNVGEITLALARLLKDAKLRSKMGEQGRRAFLEEYNWEAVKGRLIDLYEKLILESQWKQF